MTGRRTILAAPLAGLAAVIPGARTSRAAEATGEIRVAVSSTSFVLAGLRIGDRAGLYARNGLKLRIVVMDSGSAAMSALISGSVPFVVTGPPEALAARARGQDVLIVANLYAGFAGSVVLAKPLTDRLGISPGAPAAARLKALDGMVLAVPSPTSTLVAPVREAAAGAGAKVRFTYMAQGTMPAALETGAIQGMVASYPFAGTPVLRGSGVLWIDGPRGDLPAELVSASSAVIGSTGAFCAANKDDVLKIQAAVVATGQFIEQDQAGARSALAASYPDLDARDIDLAFREQWRNWTKPFLTEADIRQEAKLLASSVNLPGLDRLDPASMLLAPR